MPNLTFRSSVMGYNKSEVDEYISLVERRVTAQVEELMRENSSLKAKNQELEQSSISQAEVFSGGAQHMREMDEAVNKERLRADQFESMYTSVAERCEMLEADIRRLKSEKEQSGSIVDLLQRQIIELRHENERLLGEIREYEKQRALVAELELKAYKRAKELEYSAGLAFERSKSELQKNLELAGSAFDEFKIHTSRLSSQAIAEIDSMKDSFSYLSARIGDVAERLKDIKNIPAKFDDPETIENLEEPEKAELPEIKPHKQAEISEPAATPSEPAFTAEIPEPAFNPAKPASQLSEHAGEVSDEPVLYPVRPAAPAPIVSLLKSGIFNPFDDEEPAPPALADSELSAPEAMAAVIAETPAEQAPKADILTAIDETPKSDFDTFFDSYIKSRAAAAPLEYDPAQADDAVSKEETAAFHSSFAFVPDNPPKEEPASAPPAGTAKNPAKSNWFEYGFGKNALSES